MKYKKILLLLTITVLIIHLNSVCKNEKTSNTNSVINLGDKSLPEVKSAVLGNWKIHYSYGGITRNIKTLLSNSYFKVLPNNSIYLTFNNILFAADSAFFHRVNTPFGYSAFTMNFENIL